VYEKRFAHCFCCGFECFWFPGEWLIGRAPGDILEKHGKLLRQQDLVQEEPELLLKDPNELADERLLVVSHYSLCTIK